MIALKKKIQTVFDRITIGPEYPTRISVVYLITLTQKASSVDNHVPTSHSEEVASSLVRGSP